MAEPVTADVAVGEASIAGTCCRSQRPHPSTRRSARTLGSCIEVVALVVIQGHQLPRGRGRLSVDGPSRPADRAGRLLLDLGRLDAGLRLPRRRGLLGGHQAVLLSLVDSHCATGQATPRIRCCQNSGSPNLRSSDGSSSIRPNALRHTCSISLVSSAR